MIYVLDANAFDELTAHLWRIDFLGRLMDAGELVLITNIAVTEELMRTSDDLKRFKFGLLDTVVDPMPFTLGASTLGGPDVLASAEEAAAIRAVHTAPKHRVDALILGLAARHSAPLVTSDNRLRNRAREQGIDVLHAQDVLDYWGLLR